MDALQRGMRDPGHGPDPDMRPVRVNHIDPLEHRMQYDAAEIIHEKQIAAPSQNQAALRAERVPIDKVDDLALLIETNIAFGSGLDVECVIGLEREIGFAFHTNHRHKN